MSGSETIGIVGWGRMGGPIGRRILAAGYNVMVFDPSRDAQEDAVASGAIMVNSPRGVASASATLITMLPDGSAVTDAATKGEDGILAGLKPGAIWLEMTSSQPHVTREMAREANARGVEFVDAPVTGGVPRAREGALTVIVAGKEAALDRALPILDLIARDVIRVGAEPGMGDVAKSVNNLLSALNLLIAGEGLALAARSGISNQDMIDVINHGSGQSNATTWKIPEYVLTHRFNSGFTVGQYQKDIDIALEIAAALGLPLAASRSAAAEWRRIADSLPDRDHTEVVREILGQSDIWSDQPREEIHSDS